MSPSRPPLAGVRIVECSMLGPGAITTTLADLGADVIKVEPPTGDYIRQMTWPIVDGVSLMHLHISRGKRSITLDLRTEQGAATFLELVAPGRRRRRGHAPRRARPAGTGLRAPPRGQPPHRVLHDLRLRHDRAVQGLPEPRHRLRRVGGARARRAPMTTGSASSPSTRRSASTPAPSSAPSACSPASSRPERPARDASSRSPSPTPPRPWTGCAARPGRRTSGPRTR